MNIAKRGFTLIEVAIVITVIGILTGIAIVSWGAYVNWSQDRTREADTRQWANTFDLYKSRYYVYPLMPTDMTTPTVACLGAVGSFPTSAGAPKGADKCGQYKSSTATTYASTTATLATEVTRMGKMPVNSHEDSGTTIVDKTLVGPIVYVTQSANTGTIPVKARYINFFKNTCPSGFTESTNLTIDFPLLAALKPVGSTARVCYIETNFTYTPS